MYMYVCTEDMKADADQTEKQRALISRKGEGRGEPVKYEDGDIFMVQGT